MPGTKDGAGHDRESVLRELDVSRETSERLDAYVALLEKWQQRINLVSKSSIEQVWHRHILDSGQLFRHIPNPGGRLVDLGSGAGFPGLVLAIMGVAAVELIEVDARKAAFLREAGRITDAPRDRNNPTHRKTESGARRYRHVAGIGGAAATP